MLCIKVHFVHFYLSIIFENQVNTWGVLCKGCWPMPKMVMKSFGKRNFMQPMGRPKHALKVPCFFFLLCFGVGAGGHGEGWGRDFFSFFPTSQCARTMFLSSSQWVPNIFPNIFSIPPHFYMPWKTMSSFHLYRWAKGEELYSSI